MERLKGVPLSKLKPGTAATVSRVSDRHADKLRYMVSLGLLPGARVSVLERAPFRGPITLKVGTRRCAIDPDLADLVLVSAAVPSRHSKRK
jgi:DtxR family transcriptional regulator, Mn-dependent transcriptional regulator